MPVSFKGRHVRIEIHAARTQVERGLGDLDRDLEVELIDGGVWMTVLMLMTVGGRVGLGGHLQI